MICKIIKKEKDDDVISNSLSINYYRKTAVESVLIPTAFILREQIESIIEIGNFLKKMAIRARDLGFGPLRIYGYRANEGGVGFDSSTTSYRPEICSANEYDINMPGIHPLNSRFFTLDPDHLDQFNFHLFLGALLADNQIFIVRAGIDSNGNPLMWKNEILFAFSFLTKDIFPELILRHKERAEKPSWAEYNNGFLYPHNLDEYIILNQLWSNVQESFIENQVFITSHRFNSHTDWYRACTMAAGLPPSLEHF